MIGRVMDKYKREPRISQSEIQQIKSGFLVYPGISKTSKREKMSRWLMNEIVSLYHFIFRIKPPLKDCVGPIPIGGRGKLILFHRKPK